MRNEHLGDILAAVDDVKDVYVSQQAIRRLSALLADKDLKIPKWDLPVFPKNIRNFIEFIGVVNSVNYCFSNHETGKRFDVEYPAGSGKIWEGSLALTAAFKKALDEGIPIFDPWHLYRLDEAQLSHILRANKTPIPMFRSRLEHLKNLGKTLIDRRMDFQMFLMRHKFGLFSIFHGGYLINALSSMDCYRDVVFWNVNGKSHVLRFNKRAYLFTAVYHGRAFNSGSRLLLEDPQNVLPIADYRIPQVLRSFGVLVYGKELVERVDNRIPLKSGSDMEVGIRVQTVNAMTMLLKSINDLLFPERQITVIELDNFLYNLSKALSSEYHLTMTTAY